MFMKKQKKRPNRRHGDSTGTERDIGENQLKSEIPPLEQLSRKVIAFILAASVSCDLDEQSRLINKLDNALESNLLAAEFKIGDKRILLNAASENDAELLKEYSRITANIESKSMIGSQEESQIILRDNIGRIMCTVSIPTTMLGKLVKTASANQSNISKSDLNTVKEICDLTQPLFKYNKGVSSYKTFEAFLDSLDKPSQWVVPSKGGNIDVDRLRQDAGTQIS